MVHRVWGLLLLAAVGCKGQGDQPVATDAAKTAPVAVAPAQPVAPVPAPVPAPVSSAIPEEKADGLNRGDVAADFTGDVVARGKGKVTLSHFVGATPKTAKNGAIVAFGASWCGRCKESLATLDELSRTHKDLQILFVGTDSDEEGWEKEIALFEEKKLNFPLVRVPDPEGLVSTYFGDKRNIPRFYLIDYQGVVRVKDQGFSNAKMGKLLPKHVDYILGMAQNKSSGNTKAG